MNAFKITRLCIFCIALMGVFCSACGVKSHAAGAKSLSVAGPRQGIRTCNDPSNPRTSEDGYYCIGPDVVETRSYCLRESLHDPMHVRRMLKPDALLTLTPENRLGAATIQIVTTPQAGACKNQPFQFAKSGDWFVIVRKENSNDLTLRLFDSSKYKHNIVDTDEWKATPALVNLDLKAGENGGEFYWYGEQGDVTYFVMLTDDRRGYMNPTDKPDVPRIERYYYIEAYKRGSLCEADRPDRGSHFRRWPEKPSGDATCDVKGDPSENGTGSGGHDYP